MREKTCIAMRKGTTETSMFHNNDKRWKGNRRTKVENWGKAAALNCHLVFDLDYLSHGMTVTVGIPVLIINFLIYGLLHLPLQNTQIIQDLKKWNYICCKDPVLKQRHQYEKQFNLKHKF